MIKHYFSEQTVKGTWEQLGGVGWTGEGTTFVWDSFETGLSPRGGVPPHVLSWPALCMESKPHAQEPAAAWDPLQVSVPGSPPH